MASILLVLVVLTVKYAVMPNFERYQGEIISRVATMSGMDVSATAIRGGWYGFRPFVELENIVFREQADETRREAGAEALRLPQMRASLSWWALFFGQVRFADVSLYGPELVLSRGKDGLIYFAGRALNPPTGVEDDGRFLQALLEQPGVTIQRATLTWRDELAPGQVLRLANVGLSLDKRSNGHAIGFVATPPAGLAKKMQISGLLDIRDVAGRLKVAGTLFAQLDDANVAAIRRHLPIPDALHSGIGNVRAWIDVDNSAWSDAAVAQAAAPVSVAPAKPDDPAGTAASFNPVRAITADVNIVNARAQLAADLAPLQVARLAGRIEYAAQEGGYTVRSKALEFRTREGVSSAPADFSVTLQHQENEAKASGEIAANGIDLKVLTALLEYFPIGKELRTVVARFSPRGTVLQSSFAWTGHLEKVATYRVKGRLVEFGSLAQEKIPGVSGFSGTVEGDEKGGTFAVAAKNMQLDAPDIFSAPLKFSTFDSEGRWTVNADTIDINVARLKFVNDDLSGDVSGRYWRYRAGGARAAEEKGPGSLDIKGRLENFKATRVQYYLPRAAKSREFLEFAIRDGEVASADLTMKGTIYDFPYHQGKGGDFRMLAKVKDIDFRYAEGWPIVNDVNGEISFENTRLEARIDSGKIFNAALKKTTVAVDDFDGMPPLLTIQGTVSARAEDVSRYLKESPLIDNVGAFTRFVTLEGPGTLELGLKFPLGVKEQNKINGKYTFARARARALGEQGIDISNLNGSVAFTEASVKSIGLSGLAFDHPITINVGSATDVVAVDFNARADVKNLAGVLPFRLPQQVSGTADFTGRIATKSGATEVVIESTLLGVHSALPAPMAKRADEARKLRLQFTNTGLATEKIRVTMAGNSAGPATDDAATRIDARFQRRLDNRGYLQFLGGIASVGETLADIAMPEGLWLTGSMPRFDFDAWRTAFDGFYPAAARAVAPASPGEPAGAKSESAIAGFDFKLGGLLAYGRPFKAMTLRGRHGAAGWNMNVDSDEASGNFTWRPGAFDDRGLVRARLLRFSLVDEAPSILPAVPIEPGKEADFPALDIVAEKFTFKERELGKLELRATPQGANWKIDQLDITNSHAKMEMSGLWQRFGDPQNPAGKSRTDMKLKMETSSLNALFNQFGFGDYLKGGRATLQGQLSWPGHASQFSTSVLSGNFTVEATDGRFAKIEPGAGKLLGLMSLQSLPRRITLDFRDIFSEGLAFNKIDGEVKIASGIMSTGNFEIKGPAAYIKTSGEVSLPMETVNLRMKVAPLVGEGAAIGAAVFLTPVVGAGVYAISKMLEGALSYELSVTGPWDDPQSEVIKKNAPAAPATPPAAAPNKTP